MPSSPRSLGRACARVGQRRAPHERLEVAEHIRKTSLRRLLLGHPDEIEALGQARAIQSKHLPHQTLDSIAGHRIPDLARDRDAQPRGQCDTVGRRAGRCEHDEVSHVMLASALLDLQELATLLDSQTRRKSSRAHQMEISARVPGRVNQLARVPGREESQPHGRPWSPRRGSLAAGGRAETLAAATSTIGDDFPAVAGCHARSEAVGANPAEVVGLIGTLGHVELDFPTPARHDPDESNRPWGRRGRIDSSGLRPCQTGRICRSAIPRLIRRSIDRAKSRPRQSAFGTPPIRRSSECANRHGKPTCARGTAQTRCSCGRVRPGVRRALDFPNNFMEINFCAVTLA
jgi:hypothetical protein